MRLESRAIFVTGTDTGVGKTLASCALLRSAARTHARVVGMKPIASGLVDTPDGPISEDVLALRAASTVRVPGHLDNPVSLPDPLSPHLAAARAGRRIDIDELLAAFNALRAQAERIVVEGAGGWRVPLDERHTMADLARALDTPVVLVVGLRLGCLNHALLTAEAIRADGLTLAGWVANRIDPDMACAEENIATLRQRIAAPLLGCIPWLAAAGSKPPLLTLPEALA